MNVNDFFEIAKRDARELGMKTIYCTLSQCRDWDAEDKCCAKNECPYTQNGSPPQFMDIEKVKAKIQFALDTIMELGHEDQSLRQFFPSTCKALNEALAELEKGGAE